MSAMNDRNVNTPAPQAPRRPLDVASLQQRLGALGYADVEVVEQTGSTNTDLCARKEADNGTVLIAEEQVSGRGRMGRAWTAPARSQLIVSASFQCPGIPVDRIGLVPLLAGLAIAQGIRDTTGVNASLKWPNDVLVEGRKLVGILVEAPQVRPVPRLVVGFGVNYDLTVDELPVSHATSLRLERERDGEPELPSREDVLVNILLKLQEEMERFRGLGGAPQTFMSRYRKLSTTLDSPVRVMLPGDEVMEGTAVDISETGELVVEVDGVRHKVAAGDVVHVRPQVG